MKTNVLILAALVLGSGNAMAQIDPCTFAEIAQKADPALTQALAFHLQKAQRECEDSKLPFAERLKAEVAAHNKRVAEEREAALNVSAETLEARAAQQASEKIDHIRVVTLASSRQGSRQFIISNFVTDPCTSAEAERIGATMSQSCQGSMSPLPEVTFAYAKKAWPYKDKKAYYENIARALQTRLGTKVTVTVPDEPDDRQPRYTMTISWQ